MIDSPNIGLGQAELESNIHDHRHCIIGRQGCCFRGDSILTKASVSK